jgi:hypothetical protein
MKENRLNQELNRRMHSKQWIMSIMVSNEAFAAFQLC